MKKRPVSMLALAVLFWGWGMAGTAVKGQSVASNEPQDTIDARVRGFLDAMKGR
jgi:hypothetical protein